MLRAKSSILALHLLLVVLVLLQSYPRALHSLTKINERGWLFEPSLIGKVADEALDSGEVVTTTSSSDLTNHHHENLKSSPSLEFVHITKSGGTAIEQAAYEQANICWGARHYMEGEGCKEHRIIVNETSLSPSRYINAPVSSEPWHLPSYWWHPDPFQNTTTFTIVRNPYARVISEYYCRYFGYSGRASTKSDPVVMNDWIQKQITKTKKKRQAGHMLPSHYFVYDDDGNRRITHVLSYERLHDDFPRLIEMYKQQFSSVIQLKPKPERRQDAKLVRLGEGNLTTESIDAINEHFGKDFERFGYNQIQHPEEFSSYDFSAKVLPLWQ